MRAMRRRAARTCGRWARVAWLATAAIACPAVQAATAFIEGDAIYLERILPPPNARLIVALQDTARADAPAIRARQRVDADRRRAALCLAPAVRPAARRAGPADRARAHRDAGGSVDDDDAGRERRQRIDAAVAAPLDGAALARAADRSGVRRRRVRVGHHAGRDGGAAPTKTFSPRRRAMPIATRRCRHRCRRPSATACAGCRARGSAFERRPAATRAGRSTAAARKASSTGTAWRA